MLCQVRHFLNQSNSALIKGAAINSRAENNKIDFPCTLSQAKQKGPEKFQKYSKNIMSETTIIAEAGVNHNGDESLALALVDMASECGADIVKFQTFKADKLVRKGAEKAEYQHRGTGSGDQHSMLLNLELSDDLHYKLIERCRIRGIEFMSTAFDEESADFLVELGMQHLKIPSGELTNHPFLAHLAAKNLPIIMSTGMATLECALKAWIRHTLT